MSRALPGVPQQKAYVIANASVLNEETRLAILKIVMMEVGPSVLLQTKGTRPEVDIDLDAVAETNEEVLGHIYNIVRARLSALNQPAQFPSDQGDSGRR